MLCSLRQKPRLPGGTVILITVLTLVTLTGLPSLPPVYAGGPTLVCPGGTSYDVISGLCEAPASCPSGFTIVGSRCNGSASCPPGTTLSSTSGTCSDGSTPTCPSGTTLHVFPPPSDCSGNISCPSGTTLVASTKLCAGSPTYYCPPPPGIEFTPCVVIGQPDLTTVVSYSSPTPTDVGKPTAVAFDSKGELWVVDSSNNRVLEYRPPFKPGLAASLVIGQTGLTNSSDSDPAGSLFGPSALAFDAKGNLWVVDSGDNRVLEFVPPFSDGELASLVLGQPTFGGYIGQTNRVGLNSPAYLAFDSGGNLWLTDEGNNRVLEYTTPFSTGQGASLVIGQSNFTSADPGSAATGLFEPLGVTFDASGNLWVSDSSNHRIQEYTAPFTTGEAASTMIGRSGGSANPYAIAFDSSGDLWFTNGIDGVSEVNAPLSTGESFAQVIGPKGLVVNYTTPGSRLVDPQGLAFDSGGNLWVADYAHSRVLEYSLAVASSTVSTTSTTSTSSTSTSTSAASGGGVPELPYQPVVAVLFTVALVASYVLVKRRSQ